MKNKSLWKTLTYRIGSIVITVILLRIFMDSWYKISAYTLISQTIKALFYYSHEKIYRWYKRRFIIK